MSGSTIQHRAYVSSRSSDVQIPSSSMLANRGADEARQLAFGLKVVLMRVSRTIAAALLAGLFGLSCFAVGELRAQGEARQPVPIQFSLDRPIDAGAAP